MAKFLTTNGNANYIEELMKEAKASLTLITPYLKLTPNFIQRLKDVDGDGIKITLIYGKEQMKPSESETLFKLKNLEIYYFHNLHAKCYHNNDKLIITSMNLLEYSEKNNREMGVLFDSKEDEVIFKEALKEIKSILNNSTLEKSFSKENKPTESIPIPKENIRKDTNSQKIADEKYPSDLNYYTTENFFFPALASKLTANYPRFGTYYNKESFTFDILQKHGITILINNRLDFVFKDKETFEKFQEKHKDFIKEKGNFFRFFWNHKQINVYLLKHYEVKVDENHLNEVTNNYYLAIKTIVDLFEN
jgi:hypothetical protein